MAAVMVEAVTVTREAFGTLVMGVEETAVVKAEETAVVMGVVMAVETTVVMAVVMAVVIAVVTGRSAPKLRQTDLAPNGGRPPREMASLPCVLDEAWMSEMERSAGAGAGAWPEQAARPP